MPYRDEPGVTIYPPGGDLPAERPSRPAEGNDFNWVNTGLLDRWRGRQLAKTIQEHTGGLAVARQYTDAAATYERSRQELQYARDQAALLPLRLERDRQRIGNEIVEVQLRLEQVIRERQHAAALEQADHEIALLARKVEKLEAKRRIKEAKRNLKQAGKKPRHEAPPDSAPEEFRRHWQTEQRVRANRSEAEVRIATVYERARAERRNLSPDEIEEVDALADTAQAAEGDVRRRAASGL